jgi:HTH-type transcriptional regulator, bacterioopsin transcriptional activator and related proteins
MSPGALNTAQDISERAELQIRLRQQSMVRELGSWALDGAALRTLLDDAAALLWAGLDADLTFVLERSPDGDGLVHSRAGTASFELPRPASRRVLGAAREPLLCRDLWAEPRFQAPALTAAGMVSMVAAPIGRGPDGFGCLVACSAAEAAFVEADLGFAQSLSNVLASAVALDLLATFAPDRVRRFSAAPWVDRTDEADQRRPRGRPRQAHADRAPDERPPPAGW